MGKKIKKEEKAPPEDVFDPLQVESKEAATVVLMLDSPEEDVLAKACEAMYRFADKCDENKKVLLDLGTVDKLLKLIQSEDRIVRRNACMAFGVMAAHPDVRKLLRKQDETIPAVIHLLNPEEDTVVHEFAALCLSYMCNDFSSKVAVYEGDGVEALIRCLYSGDPDVQKNGLETLVLMMEDYQARAAVRDQNGLEPLLDLMKSEYPVIQEFALVALQKAAQDNDTRAALRELEALNRLVDFVGRPDFNDLHVHALYALSNSLDDVESMQQIKENGGLARLIAFITDTTPPEDESGKEKGKKPKSGSKKGKKGEDGEEKKTGEPSNTLPECKKHAAKAIARAAKNAENRKILHEQEAEKMLILLLSHEAQEVQIAAAQAIAVMAESLTCRDSIGQWEGIDPFIKMLKSDNSELKEAATAALANLTVSNTNNCGEVLHKNGIEPLINLLADQRETVVANAACVLTNMSVDEQMRAEIQRLGVVSAVILPLKSQSYIVQSKAALAVAAFASDANARQDFGLSNGLEPLCELLKSNNDEVRRSASWAITVIAVDEPTASELSKLGCLGILQDIQQSGTRANRFTDAAMEKLLDSNLSAKYALTGYLGPNNLIADGFFDAGQLKPGSSFRTLEDYCKDDVNQKRPILLVNPGSSALDVKAVTPTPSVDIKPRGSAGSIRARTPVKSSKDGKAKPREKSAEKSRQSTKEKQEKEEPIEESTFVPPVDDMLRKYVDMVTEKVLPLGSMKEQVVALAEFVADRMGGAIEKGQVSNFSYELQISQLKYNLQSNVIPIGTINAGIHYHRSILFKALADRIAVPCSLVRGEYNRAWNEVMLCDETTTPGAPKYPPKSYIVDLIHHPGDLLRTDSMEASFYQKI
ncbi:armadillo repeat-containing protein 3-like [Tubulanus polymorphus]|uniref:armadillo repeat-containing protein 3-like n=1 Tax=Tubulanus polymorphus TaxID=672921 RepID=UPI003DA3E489